MYVLLVCVCVSFQELAEHTTDNNKVKKTGLKGGVINFSGSMDYLYTLFAYDEDKKEKDITSGTSKELKEGAFIRLTVMLVRGVL